MKKLSNFKKFNESKFTLSKNDLEEIFIDFIDEGYLFTLYSTSKLIDSYYFDLKKQFIREFDFNLDTFKYGCQDLESMSEEVNKVFNFLSQAKTRLNSMDYDVAFEPEFNFSEDTMFSIVCRVSHSSVKEEE